MKVTINVPVEVEVDGEYCGKECPLWSGQSAMFDDCYWAGDVIRLADRRLRPLCHPACVEAVKRERVTVPRAKRLTDDDIKEALAEGAEDRRKAERAQAGLTDDEDDAWPEEG
jgi:hypothetical protein